MTIKQRGFKTVGFIIISLGTLALFFHPLLFLDKTLFLRDIHRLFFPMKYFLHLSLREGFLPYWCPNYFCGSPFMSDLQSGVFYPLSLIFLLPFPKSFNLFVVVHFFLAFYFFYLFIRLMGLSRKAALLTSVSYCYGGYTIASVNTLNNLSTLVWLPAILWAYRSASMKKAGPGHLLSILFMALALLGGEPQLFIMTMGLLLLHSFAYHDKESGAGNFLKQTAIILVFLASALLLTLVQLGPAYLDYQLSVRAGGIPYQEAVRYSLDWGMLKHLVMPLPFPADFTTHPGALTELFPGRGTLPWLLTPYPGFIIVPLAILGFLFHLSKRWMLWPVVFSLSLLLALGDNTPLYSLFYRLFPFFRFPEKFLFLTGFTLLVMAAYGFDQLLSFLKGRGGSTALLSGVFLMVLIADLYVNHRHLNPFCDAAFYRYHHPCLTPILEDRDRFRVFVDPETATPAHIRESIQNHHIKWQMMLMPNLGILHNIDNIGGITGLELRYQSLITEALKGPWSQRMHLLRAANVKYLISTKPLDKELDLAGRIKKINPLVYRVKRDLPRAWMVGQLEPVGQGVLSEVTGGSFDPAVSALAGGTEVGGYNKPFFQEVDQIRYGPGGRIHIQVRAEKPGILVLSESAYPGWRAFVDGREKPLLWLNLLFQGVELKAGTHEVDFIFRPLHFHVFLFISLISLVIFSLSWLYWRFLAKRGTRL